MHTSAARGSLRTGLQRITAALLTAFSAPALPEHTPAPDILPCRADTKLEPPAGTTCVMHSCSPFPCRWNRHRAGRGRPEVLGPVLGAGQQPGQRRRRRRGICGAGAARRQLHRGGGRRRHRLRHRVPGPLQVRNSGSRPVTSLHSGGGGRWHRLRHRLPSLLQAGCKKVSELNTTCLWR